MSEATPPKESNLTPKNVQSIKIEDEMRGAYLDYAMSVIIGRALPDVRDGLKPVHRRVLYAMYDLGNVYGKPYKKSARVVGDVIGKYHPHGDTAVYDTIVRMAQDFSMRAPLIDGQGNFGSIDGDSPAAMRYTEIRMERITNELLADLDKETVDLGDNYDGSLTEPKVLPAKYPNLLVNGSSGIAVGMATNIPPHNLGEVIDASVALIDNPDLKPQDMLQYVKGPDFPTAGFIHGDQGIKKAYLTGRGSITMRAKVEIEIHKKDRERIVVTELPYQVNKARLIEKIADLVRNKKIEGISDLRDESDRKGMRVVIDIRKGENSNVILNRLYKLTQLQDSFGISLLAIHYNQPKVFNLRDMIWAFIDHRKDVVLRRTAYDLRKAEAKAHILEGLKKAVDHIDEVIELIRAAKNPTVAKDGLIAKFSFSEAQAQAILEMRLQRLTGLEREKIANDLKEVLALIEELRKILEDETLVYQIIKDELAELKQKYGNERRTQIVKDAAEEFEVEDLIADEETLVTITHRGYIKRSDLSQFRRQNRGGRGVKGGATTNDDFMSALYRTTTLSSLLCFSDQGKVYTLKVYKIPEASRASKGKAIVNLIQLGPGEKIRAILPVREFKQDEFILLGTKNGFIKKTSLTEFENVRPSGLIAIGIRDGDELVGAEVSNGTNDVFLCSKQAKCIRFKESEVRSMGRSARGVTGMALSSDDAVVSMEVLKPDSKGAEILTITEKGYGKRTSLEDYRLQSRGGKGIICIKTTDRNGPVVGSSQVSLKDEVMLVSNQGKLIRTQVQGISALGRITQGVRVMNMTPGEKVVALERIAETSDDESNGASE